MATYKPVPYKGFGGGLNLRDGVDLVAEDQALDAMNVLFNTRGVVEERQGYSKFTVLDGAARYDSLSPFYKSDGTKQLLAGAGNRLEALTTSGSVLASIATPTASPHYFQRFGGPTAEHIYIANGADTVRRWTGAAFETPVYSGVTPNGRFLGLSVTDNRLVNARFTGTTAGNNPSTVRFSNEGDPLTFPTTGYVDLTPGDGEEIMGVATWRDQVIVFKQTKFFVFYGQSLDDEGEPVFNYRPVDAGVGLVSSRAIAVSEQGIYFLDRTGIYFTTGSQPARVSEAVEPIFHGAPSVYYTGGTLNSGSITQATMAYHNERLWLSFPAGSAATNNRQLIFDPHEKWWSLFNLPAGPMTIFRPSDVDELVFGYASGTLNIGRYTGRSYTADDMGVQYTNLVTTPSIELNDTSDFSISASSGGQPAAVKAQTNQFAKVGSFGLRYTVTRVDAVALVVRTLPGVAGIPVTPGHWYAGRVTHKLRTGTLSTSAKVRPRMYWWDSGGLPATPSSTDGPSFLEGTVIDQEVDLFVIAQAPPGSAFMALADLFNTTGDGVMNTVDTDAWMVVDLGEVWTGTSGVTTAPADVPAYFDGDSANADWAGADHDSLSHQFVADVGGQAIEAFWQSGWFNYGTPAVKTIRESKIAGTGQVTVQMFRDYRQSPSFAKDIELSPPTGLYDSGQLYDSGVMYGPSGAIVPKPLRKAIRGEAFSLRFYNNTLGRSFKVHRFTAHLREVRVPSVVKVN